MIPIARRSRGSNGAARGLVRGVLVLLAMALPLTGCGGDTPSSPPPGEHDTGGTLAATSPASASPPAGVVVTRDGDRPPDGCSPERSAGLIAGFFRAFNAGDGPELRRTFAAEGTAPPLYGVGTGGHGRGGFGTTRREELLRYFAERHGQGERLRLLQVEVRPSEREDAADVAYLLVRGADDLGPALAGAPRLGSVGYLYLGKGVIDCGTRKILAWNMDVADGAGRRYEPGAARLRTMGPCPASRNPEPGDAILACSS